LGKFFERQWQQLRLLRLFWLGLATLGVDPWHLVLRVLSGTTSWLGSDEAKGKEHQEEEQAKASTGSSECWRPGGFSSSRWRSSRGRAFVACGASFDAVGHQLHFDPILLYGGCSYVLCCSSYGHVICHASNLIHHAHLICCSRGLFDWIYHRVCCSRVWGIHHWIHHWRLRSWHYDWCGALSRASSRGDAVW